MMSNMNEWQHNLYKDLISLESSCFVDQPLLTKKKTTRFIGAYRILKPPAKVKVTA